MFEISEEVLGVQSCDHHLVGNDVTLAQTVPQSHSVLGVQSCDHLVGNDVTLAQTVPQSHSTLELGTFGYCLGSIPMSHLSVHYFHSII